MMPVETRVTRQVTEAPISIKLSKKLAENLSGWNRLLTATNSYGEGNSSLDGID